MIFTGSHWYYGVIQIALVAVIVAVAVLATGRSRKVDTVVVWTIGAYLLFYKLNEYGPFKSFPLDLSAMSYFVFILSNKSTIRSNSLSDLKEITILPLPLSFRFKSTLVSK